MVWVPPGGFAGMAQQAPAVKNRVARAGARVATGSRKRRRKKKAAGAKRARRRSTSKRAKPRKGSAAMKRKMAKLRARRKK